MGKENNSKSKLIFGALSVAASVAAGVIVKKSLDKKSEEKSNGDKPKKEKRNKSVYYTVSLNDIYNPYDDKTLSEEDMINEIRKETSL